MNLQTLSNNISGVDIYILDQILKERYHPGELILDAGCGSGRNLKWFYNADIKVFGIDTESDTLNKCKELYPEQKENFILSSVAKIPFDGAYFNHVICNAVLHFANDELHFFEMLHELIRVLKPNGSLFIRIASNFGIENDVVYLNNGTYKLPDGSTRFLLTEDLLHKITSLQSIITVEDVKTTIVHTKRSMTTLVFVKV